MPAEDRDAHADDPHPDDPHPDDARAGQRARGQQRRPDRKVLPDRSSDELDVGWGDDAHADPRDPGGRDDEWYRRERPPHHE